MPFSVSPRSYADVVSLSAGSPHARPQITPSSNLDNTTKYCHQPQRIARDRSMAEKMAEAPPSRPFFPLSLNLDNTTKYRHQPQRIARDCSMAEKMAEAPPTPQKKKCQVAAQSPAFNVSNNPKPRAKKEDVASLDNVIEGGGGKGISFRPDQLNLHLATKEQLTAALKKIIDEDREAEKEHVGDNGYNEVGEDGEYELHGRGVSSGNGEYELHGRGVSSCARSSCRTRQQTNFFADFGDDNHSDSSYEVDGNDGEEDDLDNTTGDELDDDGNDEDTMDDNDDATDDGDNDNRDGRLRALKAKLHKEKVRRRKKTHLMCIGKDIVYILVQASPKNKQLK